MKIQCDCGAKFEFDATPEMARTPVAFSCPSCGQDLSTAIHQLLQPLAPADAPVPMAVPLPSQRPPMRVTVAKPTPAPPTAQAAAGQPAEPAFCSRHGLAFIERCRTCQKPICPRCMEMFGYVCSVPCREAADKAGLALPVYEQQASLVRARARRKSQRLAVAAAAAVTVLIGVWGWYQFVASKPRVAASLRFADEQDDGEVRLVPPSDVLVRRGGRLTRFDLAARKPVWTVDVPASADASHWHVRRQDVWVASKNKLVRHDWRSGAPAREVPLPGPVTLLFGSDTTLSALVRGELGRQFVVRLNLDTDEVKQEEVTTTNVASGRATGSRPAGPAPVAVTPGGGGGPAPMRAARAIAMLGQRPLPADDAEDSPRESGSFDPSRSEVVGGAEALVQLNVKLVESKTVEVQAMKPPSSRSALDGPINAAATVGILNETLNESQRESTGGVEHEDASRYQVNVHRLLEPGPGWTGEVIGTPELFPLRTVDLLIAGKKLLAIDPSGRKLWDSQLAYPVPELPEPELEPADESAPLGACVQRGNSIYVFDLGVLTAFDATSGHVRWRLPSVGVRSLRFDDAGALYVNTTDAEQDSVKFRQQIDIERQVRSLILKVEPGTGRILWRTRHRGQLAKATGGFLYAVEWAGGNERARARPGVVLPHVRIYRLNPESGLVLWEHYEGREPIALDFHGKTIEILFRNELQTLKFASF